MKNLSFRKIAALAAMALLLGSTLFVNPSRAQICNCLAASTSNIMLCGCYTFELTNICDSAISAINITDSAVSPLDSGCAQLTNPTHETWKVTLNANGSVTITRLPGDPCLQPGKSILISMCNMQKGDNINIGWTNCGGSSPFPFPCGPYPPGEQVVAP